MNPHPFDHALQLAADPVTPGLFHGTTSPAYGNMVGPYGGITAATLVQAIWQHPQRLGEPLALTLNFASGTAAGPYQISAAPVRTTRSTQHWVLSLTQLDAAGQAQVVITATAMTALRRDTWQMSDVPMPAVAAAHNLARAEHSAAMEWFSRYDMRCVRGAMPAQWDGTGQSSLTQLWVRDEPLRALDFASLTAMSDVFYPRIWLRRATRVAAGTVSMTVYLHASARQLEEAGSGYLLAQAQTQIFQHGFFDQTAQLWSEAGTLLATSHQLVYYKE